MEFKKKRHKKVNNKCNTKKLPFVCTRVQKIWFACHKVLVCLLYLELCTGVFFCFEFNSNSWKDLYRLSVTHVWQVDALTRAEEALKHSRGLSDMALRQRSWHDEQVFGQLHSQICTHINRARSKPASMTSMLAGQLNGKRSKALCVSGGFYQNIYYTWT